MELKERKRESNYVKPSLLLSRFLAVLLSGGGGGNEGSGDKRDVVMDGES